MAQEEAPPTVEDEEHKVFRASYDPLGGGPLTDEESQILMPFLIDLFRALLFPNALKGGPHLSCNPTCRAIGWLEIFLLFTRWFGVLPSWLFFSKGCVEWLKRDLLLR
ncbi:hypothetical protein AMTR_s00060p00194750 [Amborella trichopoda]|uniref:Uncharacterized protein n=1 Tax=Amborella trichopoda TaxID=13333 RepID=W1NL43_AMBTC|nr:hypothetical protein AMTR_s00060p00194750 [Amborella trichopoda]